MLNYGTLKNTNSYIRLYTLTHAILLLVFLSCNLNKADTLGFLHIYLEYAVLFLDDNMDEGREYFSKRKKSA